LSKGDVQLRKLFRQTVPPCWPGGGKTVVTELVVWSLDQARSIVSGPHRTAASSGNHRVPTHLENLENLENSWNCVNLENSWKSPGILW